MTTSRVSVVMAVYDGERYLEEALASVRDQTFTDYEFVIVDDGSRDGTRRILEHWRRRDGRIRLLRSAANEGLIAALNRGVAAADGDLIARMDADDVCKPRRLEAQTALLAAETDVGVVGTGYDRLFDDGRRTGHCPPLAHTEIRWRLLFGSVWPHSAVMFRRDLIGADEPCYGDFLYAEDYELWARLAQRTRCATLPESLITIRTREAEGISARNRDDQRRTVARISAQQIAALNWDNPPDEMTISGMQQLATLRLPQEPVKAKEAVTALLDVFEVLADESGADRDTLATLRRSWVRRMLVAAVASGHMWALWRSGFFGAVLERDARSLVPGILRGSSQAPPPRDSPPAN